MNETEHPRYEQRRLALLRLVEQLGHGAISKIGARIGVVPNYVSRMLYEPGKEGRKRITEKFAEALDAEFPGWRGGIVKAATNGQATNGTTMSEAERRAAEYARLLPEPHLSRWLEWAEERVSLVRVGIEIGSTQAKHENGNKARRSPKPENGDAESEKNGGGGQN